MYTSELYSSLAVEESFSCIKAVGRERHLRLELSADVCMMNVTMLFECR